MMILKTLIVVMIFGWSQIHTGTSTHITLNSRKNARLFPYRETREKRVHGAFLDDFYDDLIKAQKALDQISQGSKNQVDTLTQAISSEEQEPLYPITSAPVYPYKPTYTDSDEEPEGSGDGGEQNQKKCNYEDDDEDCGDDGDGSGDFGDIYIRPGSKSSCSAPFVDIAYKMCILPVLDKRLTWKGARDYCTERGLRLALDPVVVKSRRYLHNTLGEQGTRTRFPVWVGAKHYEDDYGNGRWKWNDGLEVPDFLWADGQPQSYQSYQTPEGLCFILDGFEDYYGKSLPCHYRRRFVCERIY